MKKLMTAATLTLALSATGCLGPNKTFRGLQEWNQEVSDKDWVNEVVFIGFHIIPVYELVYLFDVVALNTIEYWTEKD